MQTSITLIFQNGARRELTVDASEVLSYEAARRWLDDEFVRLQCEPLRGSGKVLIADKLIGIALAASERGFEDAAWGLDYARAAAGALSKALIRVDLERMVVGY